LGTYSKFKSVFAQECYVTSLKSYKLRKALAKLRCSSHALGIEKGRHKNIPHEDRICKTCEQKLGERFIEDEYHFICICTSFCDLRQKFFPGDVYTNPDEQNCLAVMSSQDPIVVRSLAIYINEAFKLRMSLVNV
jgi:hypothetical protein